MDMAKYLSDHIYLMHETTYCVECARLASQNNYGTKIYFKMLLHNWPKLT